jgi:hypothetical protein
VPCFRSETSFTVCKSGSAPVFGLVSVSDLVDRADDSDVSSFGAIQTLPSWLRDFGEESNGKYVLGTTRKSIMNSGEHFRAR